MRGVRGPHQAGVGLQFAARVGAVFQLGAQDQPQAFVPQRDVVLQEDVHQIRRLGGRCEDRKTRTEVVARGAVPGTPDHGVASASGERMAQLEVERRPVGGAERIVDGLVHEVGQEFELRVRAQPPLPAGLEVAGPVLHRRGHVVGVRRCQHGDGYSAPAPRPGRSSPGRSARRCRRSANRHVRWCARHPSYRRWASPFASAVSSRRANSPVTR